MMSRYNPSHQTWVKCFVAWPSDVGRPPGAARWCCLELPQCPGGVGCLRPAEAIRDPLSADTATNPEA